MKYDHFSEYKNKRAIDRQSYGGNYHKLKCGDMVPCSTLKGKVVIQQIVVHTAKHIADARC